MWMSPLPLRMLAPVGGNVDTFQPRDGPALSEIRAD